MHALTSASMLSNLIGKASASVRAAAALTSSALGARRWPRAVAAAASIRTSSFGRDATSRQAL